MAGVHELHLHQPASYERPNLDRMNDQDIVALYHTGKTIEEIALHFGKTFWVCRAILHRAGVVRPKGVPKTGVGLSTEVLQTIESLYRSGISGAKIATRLGLDRTMTYRALRQMKTTIRDQSHSRQEHAIDERFFDDIDSETKAYWLGFIAADGNVHKNCFQIDLMASDRKHLEKLKRDLRSSHPITDRAVTRHGRVNLQSRFALSNKALVAGLAKHHIYEKKSETVMAWNGNPFLTRHYWRGVIDGDGSLFRLGEYSDGTPRWSLSLAGSRHMCDAFLVWCNSISPSKASVHPGNGRVWSVGIRSRLSVRCIVAALYSDSVVHLDRKNELAAQIMSPPQSFGKREAA